jgi:hypothetical protein
MRENAAMTNGKIWVKFTESNSEAADSITSHTATHPSVGVT